MSNKKGFLIYADIIGMVEKLDNDRAGKLFKMILCYVNEREIVCDDLVLEVAFEPIKQALIRDSERYKTTCDVNKKNGRLGGRPSSKAKKPSGYSENPTKPSGYSENRNKAKKPDIERDSDIDIDRDKENESVSKGRTRANGLYDLPFRETDYVDFDIWKLAMKENPAYEDFKRLDFKHYHAVISEWAMNSGAKKINWIAFSWAWVRKDHQKGQAVYLKPRIAL